MMVPVGAAAAPLSNPLPLPPITPNPNNKPRINPAKARRPSNPQQIGPQQPPSAAAAFSS
jgi:hypothetical protein